MNSKEWTRANLSSTRTLAEGNRILHVEVTPEKLQSLLGESINAIYTNPETLESVCVYESDISTPSSFVVSVRSYGKVSTEDTVASFVMDYIDPEGLIREEYNNIPRDSVIYECRVADQPAQLNEFISNVQLTLKQAAEKLRRLKRGRRVKFIHSNGNTVTGAFRGLFVRQGRPYAHVVSGQNTYYVPAHRIMYGNQGRY